MENTERKSKLIPLTALLSAMGAGISIWQTSGFYATRSGMGAFHSFCNIGKSFDCTAIEISKYSELAGFPLSGIAIAGYLIILILSLFGLSTEHRKSIRPYLVAFTGIAVLFSAIYLTIMLGVIGKLCLLCLAVDAINIVLFISALKLPKETQSSGGFSFSHLVGTGLASLLIAFLFTKGLDPQSEMKKEDMNDIIESILASPSVPIDIPANAPFIGPAQAPITIVKFSDYECPACKMGATAIHPLFKRYEKEVKFVFLNYPLDQACNPYVPRRMHEFACEAAMVAVCATEQGKFQEAYENLFDHQKDFAHEKIADLLLSKVQGLDAAKLKACTSLPSTMERLKVDVTLGGKDHLNIQSTPTFFINGKKVEGGLPTNMWIQIIDKLLAK